MTQREIKNITNGIVPTMTFIGSFANYNDLRKNGRREKGCMAVAGKKRMLYAFDGKRWLMMIYRPVMPKIMFNEYFGLQSAAIDGRKTMTRRTVVIPKGVDMDKIANVEIGQDRKGKVMATFYGYTENMDRVFLCDVHPRYQVGDRVAIAQSYGSIVAENPGSGYGNYDLNLFRYDAGWKNKMFVKSELMRHHILIKDIGIERLQDISDEDCLREGIYVHNPDPDSTRFIGYAYDATLGSDVKRWWFHTPREAFAELIRKMSGRKAWDNNPWVWVYEFEIEK